MPFRTVLRRAWAGVLPGCCAVAALLVLGAGCATFGGGAQRAVLRAKDKVAPALVHIRPVKEVFARGKRQEVVTIGSGFIISPDGYVVTNEHVAGESKQVHCVLSSKEEVEAEVVGVDPYTDIAVLRLEVDHPLPYVKLGVSGALEPGQIVLALGSPHGLARSVSMGIISVTDRHLEGGATRASPYNNWIQTDAAINPGNSGGPLVNLRGEVVGVNSRMLRGAENVGFAIPADVAREVVAAIIEKGRVQRAWLGVSLQEMRAKTDDTSVRGVIIADVNPLSPAREAGVRPGDVLVAVNGTPTHARFEEDLPAVRKCIADLPVGEAATLTVLRGEENLDIEVAAEEQSNIRGSQAEFEEWGFTAAELTPEIVRRAQLPSRQGVLISGVQEGGIAMNARLRPGDIVLTVDEEAVESLDHFVRTYKGLVESKKRLTLLEVKQNALTRFVLVKQEQDAEAAAYTEDAAGAD